MQITPEATPTELYPHVLGALRAWHSGSAQNLLEFLLLVREVSAAQNQNKDPQNRVNARRRFTNEILLEGIESLALEDEEGALILRERFIQKQNALKVAFDHHLTRDQVNRRQHDAIMKLCDLLLQREISLRSLRARELEPSLSARQYSRLFGIEQTAAEITGLLTPGKPPWVVALSGIGGIGKTALAHYLTPQLVSSYSLHTILWIFTPSPFGPAVDPQETYTNLLNELAGRLGALEGPPDSRRAQAQRILKSNAYLVVVDNLESETDTAFLLEKLYSLAQPSKFLLTTRANPAGPSGIFTHRMRELGYEDAAALVRDHSQEISQGETAIENDDQLQAIYHAVGGNPLALKLVASLTARFPLPVILEDLGERRLNQTDEMYNRIYERAWEALSQEARELLEGMPLVADNGGSPQQLLAVSGLPEKTFWAAIEELLKRSLLEARGTAAERRYGIHQLTRAFLHSRVIRK